MDNGSSSNASSSSFFFDNYQEMQNCETSPGVVPAANSPGRLPPMSHFGFGADSCYKLEQHPKKSNFNFQNDLKPPKPEKPRITDHLKEKKKSRAATKRMMNRFNGMSEEEVAKRGLPDYLREGLDIVFIGINPSMFAAYTGKYYDGPGNHFWQALHLSGLLPELMCADDDHKLLDLGIGFTNIVARTTRGLSDLTRVEIAEGAKILREKLMKYKPKIAVFNGKAIYEVYSGQKKFMFGRQPEPIVSHDSAEKTWLWVMPSSSARCAQLPRAVDKVPFFDALRKFRDFLSGKMPQLDTREIVFANVTLRNAPRKLKTEPSNFFLPVDDRDRFVDYTKLEPWTDGRPAQVPPSVDAVIESVIKKGGKGSIQVFDDLDDDDDDLDFKDEDSNGIGEMNFKEEDLS
jgi:TDG/mug DNA glycosylase family protein